MGQEALHLFTPRLQLIPEDDGEYSLLATTSVPHAQFAAGAPVQGAPKGVKGKRKSLTWQLPLTINELGSLEPSAPREVYHRVRSLKLKRGDRIRVFVVLADGMPVGTACLTLKNGVNEGRLVFRANAMGAAERQVPASTCRSIVVAATPRPGKFTNNAQLLKDLGVVDSRQTEFHIDGIVNGMSTAGGSIDPDTITTGPQVSVGACAASVFQNQDGAA